MSTDLYAPIKNDDEDVVVLAVKMPKALRDQWQAHCESHKVNMSEVLRRFIRNELQAAKLAQREPEATLIVGDDVFKG